MEDAIARASFLRSRVSSHKLGRKAASLTALDVANVQLLARRLLLEHLGVFKYMDGPRRSRSSAARPNENPPPARGPRRAVLTR